MLILTGGQHHKKNIHKGAHNEKNLSLTAAVSLAFSALSIPLTSHNVNAATESAQNIQDVVPQKYFDQTKGKYKSFEEVRKATGFEYSQSSNSTTDSGIIVNTVDEYAALLTYVNDLSNPVSTSPLKSAPFASATALYNGTQTYTHVFGDIKFSWIDAYAIVTYANGKVTATKTDSQIRGFNPSISWEHSAARSYTTLNASKTGGSAYVSGELKLVLILEGIGTISQRPMSTSFGF